MLNTLPIIYLGAALLDFILFTLNENFGTTQEFSYDFQFWISAGFIESAGMFSLLMLIKKRISFRIIRFIYFMIPLIFILLILLDLLPSFRRVDGSVNFLGYFSTILIVLVFIADILLVNSRKKVMDSSASLMIVFSLGLSAFAILANLIQNPLFRIISLLIKASAYHQLYSGIVLSGVLSPLKRMKEKEDALRKEQYYYAQTLSAVKDGMFRYYPERNILEVSDVWLEMTGYSLKYPIINENLFRQFFPYDEYNKLKRSLDYSFHNSIPLTEEFRMSHQNGHSIWVLIRGSNGSDQNGDDCFIGIMTDISWRKKIEQELIQSKDKAEESDRIKTTFLANISHEIRTPLNVILGFTGLILKDLPDDEKTDERMKSLEIVRQSSNQLISIISDIIDISRIQNEKISLQYQLISINSFFRNIHTVYRKLMDDRGKEEIRLTWFIPNEITGELSITTDIERFHQIWQNLLNNSMKFIEYGQIRYGVESVDSQNNRIFFFVEDTGPGISKDKDAIIFDRFRQGEEGFARRYGGSGLGLAITRELLHLMGGNISLDNDYQGGARFLFDLPENHA